MGSGRRPSIRRQARLKRQSEAYPSLRNDFAKNDFARDDPATQEYAAPIARLYVSLLRPQEPDSRQQLPKNGGKPLKTQGFKLHYIEAYWYFQANRRRFRMFSP